LARGGRHDEIMVRCRETARECDDRIEVKNDARKRPTKRRASGRRRRSPAAAATAPSPVEPLQLHDELGSTVKILGTKYLEQDFTLLDILNPAASKGAGVAAAAAELGATREEIMAIGDNYNDLEMLLFAGTGVVMANAPLSLREIAGLHPTASNKDDGVALAIERFILTPPQSINQ